MRSSEVQMTVVILRVNLTQGADHQPTVNGLIQKFTKHRATNDKAVITGPALQEVFATLRTKK